MSNTPYRPDASGPLPPRVASLVVEASTSDPPRKHSTTLELLTWQCELLAEQRDLLRSIKKMVSTIGTLLLIATGILIVIAASRQTIRLERPFY